jgi:hypothetical protein
VQLAEITNEISTARQRLESFDTLLNTETTVRQTIIAELQREVQRQEAQLKSLDNISEATKTKLKDLETVEKGVAKRSEELRCWSLILGYLI